MRSLLRKLKIYRGVVKNMVVKSGKGNRIMGILSVLFAIVFWHSEIELLVGELCFLLDSGWPWIVLWLWMRKDVPCLFLDLRKSTCAFVFSVHRIHKPRWMQAYDYSFLMHPFSFFFVYCPLRTDGKDNKKKMGFAVWGGWERIFGANEKLECRVGGYQKKGSSIKGFSVSEERSSKSK